jgi:short subunit dehydrogenase-like uncharacterized protein
MIGLLGATGYTGALTAEVLTAAGVEHRRGGRSAQKLAALPRSEHAHDVVVDTTSPRDVDAFLDGCDAVINTVGPFMRLGRDVIEAAIRTRTPYVDCTGEPDFLRWLHATHADAPVPLVSACGMEYVPGDAAVALAAAQVGGPAELTDILVGYHVRGGRFSRGTLQTLLDSSQVTPWRPRPAMIPFTRGELTGLEVPWGEAELTARRSPGARVRTAFAMPRPMVRGIAAFGPVVELTGRRTTKIARPLLQRGLDRMSTDGPGLAMRERNVWTVVAAVRHRDGRAARAELTGSDGYGLTADLLAACGQRVAKAEPGARSPAEAFDVEELLGAVAGPRLRWTIG